VTPDCINGVFELSGAVFIWLHVRRALKEKALAGVSTMATAFFEEAYAIRDAAGRVRSALAKAGYAPR
jgi:hypothetical protein